MDFVVTPPLFSRTLANIRISAASRLAFGVIDFDAQLCRHQTEIMLRDDRSQGGRRPAPARNVLGEPLEICSFKPMTGFYPTATSLILSGSQLTLLS